MLPENSASSFLAGMCCAMDAIEAGGGDCCGWIAADRCLPQELADRIHPDGLCYEVTIQKDATVDIGFCRFQGGHWWEGVVPVDTYVIAWRKHPVPYQQKKEKNHEKNS